MRLKNCVHQPGFGSLDFYCRRGMRNALNNFQSTHAGFATVNDENVFKGCDQPHYDSKRYNRFVCKS